MRNFLTNNRRKLIILLITLFCLLIIISLYLIFNRSSADTAINHNLPFKYKPSPATLIKQGEYKTIKEAEAALVDSSNPDAYHKIIKSGDSYIPTSIIVKLKNGEDLSKIVNDPKVIQEGEYHLINIESSEPLYNVTILQHSLKNAIAKSPKKEKEITNKFNDLGLSNFYLVKVKDPSTIYDQAKKLNSYPSVDYAEVDELIHIQSIPNDPYYHSSGSWGQDYDDLWGLKKINPEVAWDTTQGEGIVVAITDSGIDYNHEDLADNIWINEDEIPDNQIDDDNNGYVDDVRGWDFIGLDHERPVEDNDPIDRLGHGTHVAGTVAAIADNSIGILGIAPKAKIMAIKGISDNGFGLGSTLSKSIIYAADNGAKIINASWGSPGYCAPGNPNTAIRYAHDIMGVIFIASAGNYNTDDSFKPACDLNATAVASTTHNDQKSDFSNYGDYIDITAPGGDSTDWNDRDYKFINILSIRALGTDLYGDGKMIVDEKYFRMSGTSMAAPHVSGVAALIYSIKPDFTPNTVERILEVSADDLGDLGWDKYYGNGRVNASSSVDQAELVKTDVNSPESPNNFRVEKLHPYYIDLAWDESVDNNIIVDYTLYRDGHEILKSYTHTFHDFIVEPGNQYEYSIKAFDGSNYSDIVTISVTTPIDTEPPTAPTNLVGQAFAKKIDLSWAASSDNYGLSSYRIYRNGNFYGRVEKEYTTFTDNQVEPNTTYSYYLRAYDSSGNESDSSNILNLQTSYLRFIDSNIEIEQIGYTKSIAWGDYDNDGDLDFVSSGSIENPLTSDKLSQIYRNDGKGRFTAVAKIEEGGAEMYNASYDWGDYDNDGDLDLAVAGQIYQDWQEGFITKIYTNKGNDRFETLQNLLSIDGNTAWADFDNDGDLDLALSGYDKNAKYFRLVLYQNINSRFSIIESFNGHGSIGGLQAGDYDNDGDMDIISSGINGSFLYRNQRNFNFSEIEIDFKNFHSGNAAWADFDNDGDLDLAISEGTWWEEESDHTILYENIRGTFIKAVDLRVWSKSLAWADYDNDGDLDLLTTGYHVIKSGGRTYPYPQTKIFRNEQNHNFIDIGSEIINIMEGTASWADYDNDGDLDIIIGGVTKDNYGNSFNVTRIYKNRTANKEFNAPNQKPNPPSNINISINNHRKPYSFKFTWNRGSDQETKKALYYSVRLGAVVKPNRYISGTYGTPLFGNYLRPKISNDQLGILFNKQLPPGIYIIGVRSIDSGLRPSNWHNKMFKIK